MVDIRRKLSPFSLYASDDLQHSSHFLSIWDFHAHCTNAKNKTFVDTTHCLITAGQYQTYSVCIELSH